MNKTIDISLAGILFHLDDNAYYKLKKYLKSVRQSIQQPEDIDEVIHEIEARIAELLMQKQKSPQHVINEKHIDEVISVLGQPEDFEDEVQPEISQKSQQAKKSLFRDMDNSMIAGIAAGIAHYFSLDVTLLRLIFVIILFVTHGSFILIYFLLWILVPKAKTATDKLKMKGESANIDNIVDQVSTDDAAKKKVNLGETIETTGSEIGDALVKIIGFVLLLGAGTIILGLLISVLSISPLSDINLVLQDNLILQNLHIPVRFISFLVIFVLIFPVVLLFLLGFKMLFPQASPWNKNLMTIIGTLWFIALIYMLVKTVRYFSYKNASAGIVTLNSQWQTDKDTLYIDAKTIKNLQNYTTSNNIKFHFHVSKDSKFHVKVKKIAEGVTYKNAKKNALNIDYNMAQDSIQNRLVFASMIRYPTGNLISNHKVRVRVEIPEGKFVKLSEPISRLSYFSDCSFPELLINKDDEISCLKAYENISGKSFYLNIDGDKVQVKIDDNGVEINGKDNDDSDKASIKINDDGIEIQAKDGEKKSSIQINADGVKIENNQ